jgi:hypothetical protein
MRKLLGSFGLAIAVAGLIGCGSAQQDAGSPEASAEGAAPDVAAPADEDQENEGD